MSPRASLMKDQLPAHRLQESTGFYSVIHRSILCDSDEEFHEKVKFPEAAIQRELETVMETGEILDPNDARDEAMDSLHESLDYCLYYYIPEDWEKQEDRYIRIALDVGLTPFYLRGTLMLALGSCGMDLSSRLDAFQVLARGTIRPDSLLFRDPKYFKYVVGEEIFRKVINKLME